MIPPIADLTHIRGPLGDLFKEIIRRAELRLRLEAESGKSLSDQEFLAIAEKSGLKI